MLDRVFAAVLGILAAISSPAQVRPPTALLPTVPLGRSFAIHAAVDGHDALLEVDTGSFELRLSPDFVKKWGIDNHRITLKVTDLPAMTMTPLVENLVDPDTPLLGVSFQPTEDGIIGLDVLRRFAIGIDTVGGRVAFWNGGKIGANSAAAWAQSKMPAGVKPLRLQKLPLETNGEDDWYRIKAAVNGKPLHLVLDTGTAYSTVNPSQVSPLHLKIIGETIVEGIGQTERLLIATAETLAFGPFSADFPIVNVEKQEDSSSDGILGTEALGDGVFVIDMPDKALYAGRVKRTTGNPLELRLRAAGLDIFPDNRLRLLVLVQPGSPAAKAGIQSGDRLTKIGDLTVEELTKGLQDQSDPKVTRRLLDLGLKAIAGDLSITTQHLSAVPVDLALPKLEKTS